MATRKTVETSRTTVVYERQDVRVVRVAGKGWSEYRAYVVGVEISGPFDRQHEAEQAANAAMYALLAQKAA
jgi:hypothetical protein